MLESRIKELRKKSGLTMLALGQLINIGESTISLYESGKRQPSYDVLKDMAMVFRCSTDYLLGRTDDPSPFKIKAAQNEQPLSEDDKIFRELTSDLTEGEMKDVQSYIDFVKSKRSQ